MLKLINGTLNGSALLGYVSGESFSSLDDVLFGFNSAGSECCFEVLAISDESGLEFVAACLKGSFSIVFVGGEVVLKLISCTIKCNKEVLKPT